MGSSLLPVPAASQPHGNPYKPRLRFIGLAFIVLLCWLQFVVLPTYLYHPSESQRKLSQSHLDRLNAGLERCTELSTPPVLYTIPASKERKNPRWNSVNGQKRTIVLRNATLFDGEHILAGSVDIKFSDGAFTAITSTKAVSEYRDVEVVDLGGRFVTPGLVDMHSHHMIGHMQDLEATGDTNEINKESFGPLTPFVRSLDGLKPYDPAIAFIASGGITTSLILPGSANIIGGEAYPIKNYVNAGSNSEPVVDEMLLEYGIPEKQRRRYMKMAQGENPRGVYSHTRMGDAYLFRKHMSRAKELLERQDEWCLSAAAARETGHDADIHALTTLSAGKAGLPEELELESTVALLRGQVNLNVHCYETEDFEDMLRHSREFGFKVRAFHHALSAWQVPEMIKDLGDNITIATFAEMGLYKMEAYRANLWAGSILAEHHVPVAYKSDHGMEETFAKYLMHQAAVGHSFHLPEELALQSVTSVPARSMQADHRIGYVRPGHDADLVVWDSHPLSNGATPLQVYIDGKATLDPDKVAKSMPRVSEAGTAQTSQARMRTVPKVQSNFCLNIERETRKQIVITGIRKSFVHTDIASPSSSNGNLTMVLTNGTISCFGTTEQCAVASINGEILNLQNGHVLPGITAVSNSLGLKEIDQEESTGDGAASSKGDVLDPKTVGYAKHGIHLEGRAFERARYGGVTRAIQRPLFGGFMGGVSVAIKTSGKNTLLDGGIVADDVALHVAIGQAAKQTESINSVSTSIEKLRSILIDNLGKDNVYGRAANGSLPVAVHVENKYDIMHLIKLKQERPSLNIIIIGGSGAHAVAKDLAAAKIPVILSSWRCAPDTWEKKDCLVGPPLTKSSVEVLTEAGVLVGLAINAMNDAYIHNHLLEASWAVKYTSNLTDHDAVDLVSRNIEEIFGLDVEERYGVEAEREHHDIGAEVKVDDGGVGKGKEGRKRDFVVWEGNPLEFGASVVVTVDGDGGGIVGCWPEVE